jgi:hypothetical protein
MCNSGVGIYASMHGVVISKGYYIKECVIMYMEKERQRYHLNNQQQLRLITSHLVKHTANVIRSSVRPSRSFMVMVHLGTAHAHAGLSGRCC